jgi:hypothetical protein
MRCNLQACLARHTRQTLESILQTAKVIFKQMKTATIDIDRYGFRIPQSSAKVFTEGSNPKARLNTLENLQEVARLHKTLPHGSKIADIAQALQIDERLARFYVAECRT